MCKERNLICLGLYRLSNSLDNSSPFCYTNPKSDEILNHRDKVFVLTYNMPDDLSKFFFKK